MKNIILAFLVSLIFSCASPANSSPVIIDEPPRNPGVILKTAVLGETVEIVVGYLGSADAADVCDLGVKDVNGIDHLIKGKSLGYRGVVDNIYYERYICFYENVAISELVVLKSLEEGLQIIMEQQKLSYSHLQQLVDFDIEALDSQGI